MQEMKRCRISETRFDFTWRARIWRRWRWCRCMPDLPRLSGSAVIRIFRQASRYIPDHELRRHFFTE